MVIDNNEKSSKKTKVSSKKTKRVSSKGASMKMKSAKSVSSKAKKTKSSSKKTSTPKVLTDARETFEIGREMTEGSLDKWLLEWEVKHPETTIWDEKSRALENRLTNTFTNTQNERGYKIDPTTWVPPTFQDLTFHHQKSLATLAPVEATTTWAPPWSSSKTPASTSPLGAPKCELHPSAQTRLPTIQNPSSASLKTRPKRFVDSKDGTVNHVYPDGSEFRLVKRSDHDTIYLSSHTGCGLACKQCHLTANDETRMVSLFADEILERARVLHREAGDHRINYSFMARGDPLANRGINDELMRDLLGLRRSRPIRRIAYDRVTISSIFPNTLREMKTPETLAALLLERFGAYQPTIFFSAYSADSMKRAQLMPRATELHIVAHGLRLWQETTGHEVVVHHPIIKDWNDGLADARTLFDILTGAVGLRYRVNLIQFNPPPGSLLTEVEQSVYLQHQHFWRQRGIYTQVQARVGTEVAASCGMFMTGMKNADANANTNENANASTNEKT